MCLKLVSSSVTLDQEGGVVLVLLCCAHLVNTDHPVQINKPERGGRREEREGGKRGKEGREGRREERGRGKRGKEGGEGRREERGRGKRGKEGREEEGREGRREERGREGRREERGRGKKGERETERIVNLGSKTNFLESKSSPEAFVWKELTASCHTWCVSSSFRGQ